MEWDSEKSAKRFMRFVGEPDKNGCTEWSSVSGSKGYGVFSYQGRAVSAHRIAWKIANKSEIPSGMYVCHKCDNPPCVNPDHLFIGTPKDNINDMHTKGRFHPRGLSGSGVTMPTVPKIRKSNKRIVTEDAFRTWLREEINRDGMQKATAKRFGLSPQFMNDILQGHRKPGELTLGMMGWRRVVRVTYERVQV